MRPLIGISGSYCTEGSYFYYKEAYVQAVYDAGGTTILLPSVNEVKVIMAYLNSCQGILLTGGGDLDAAYWGEYPNVASGEIDPVRDRFEMRLARYAWQYGKPVLGICRGCQVMNVAAGGSLVQDIKSPLEHMQKAPRAYPIHDIFIETPSQLADILGQARIRVNSFHHQSISRPGSGLSVAAMAGDGVVEAIESSQRAFYVGVQWHPEGMRDEFSNLLFAAFVEAATEKHLFRI